MQFADLLQHRRSTRLFRPDPVTPEQLEAILAAANAAPSAGDLQAYEVVCAHDAAVRDALAEAALQPYVAEAPVALVFFADPKRASNRYGSRGEALYALQDATIACAYAQLRAADLGLGTVWVGAFDEAAVSRATAAPAPLRPVAVLPIGVPAEQPEPRPRRGVADLARDDRFA